MGPHDHKVVSVDVGHLKLRIYQGDITQVGVDAIVNGTNSDMDLSEGNIHFLEYYVSHNTCRRIIDKMR